MSAVGLTLNKVKNKILDLTISTLHIIQNHLPLLHIKNIVDFAPIFLSHLLLGHILAMMKASVQLLKKYS